MTVSGGGQDGKDAAFMFSLSRCCQEVASRHGGVVIIAPNKAFYDGRTRCQQQL